MKDNSGQDDLRFACRLCGECDDFETKCLGVTITWYQRNNKQQATKPEIPTSLVQCNNCRLAQWTRGFSEIELNLIYSDYRSKGYQSRRQRFEPWYTHKVNSEIGSNLEIIRVRKSHLQSEIIQFCDQSGLRMPSRVLDFGGDRGQFIPDLTPNDVKYVFEVNGHELEKDVRRITHIEDVREIDPELIMVCHVLEHLMDPVSELKQILSRASGGTIIYLEVPQDCPTGFSKLHLSRRYAGLMRFLWKFRIIAIALDLVSLISKQIFGRVIFFGVNKQSEHINFWDEKSLEYLCQQLEITDLQYSNYRVPGLSSGSSCLSVIGVLKNSF